MIHLEAWAKEADERSLRGAYEKFRRGDISAAGPFWGEVVRLHEWPDWISYEDVMRTPDEVLEIVMPGHRILRAKDIWTTSDYSDDPELSEWGKGKWDPYSSSDSWEVDENWKESGEHPLLHNWRHSRSGHGNPEWSAPTIFGDFDSGNPYDVEQEDGGYLYYAEEELTRIEGPYERQIADLAWRFAKRSPNP